MGAQASTNKNKISTEINSIAKNKCPTVSAVNEVSLKGVEITCPEFCAQIGECKGGIQQTAMVDATCILNAQQDALSEAISQMDASVKTGLGLGASTNISDVKKKLRQEIENSCGTVSANNKISVASSKLNTCDNTFIQNATAKSQCQMASLQKIQDKVVTEQVAKTEGYDPMGAMKAYAYVIAGIIGLIVLIIVGVIVKSTMGGGSGAGTTAGTYATPYGDVGNPMQMQMQMPMQQMPMQQMQVPMQQMQVPMQQMQMPTGFGRGRKFRRV
jgi:hypothetical protein